MHRSVPSRPSTRRTRSGLAVAAVALLGLAACGGDDGDAAPAAAPSSAAAPTTAAPTTAAPTTAAPTTAAPTTAAPGTAAPATTGAPASNAPTGTAVAVELREFAVGLPATTLTPGTYTFQLANVGDFKHDLVVSGPGVDEVRSEVFESGQSGTLTVTLQPGTYQFFCDIPTHRGKGMEQEVTVP